MIRSYLISFFILISFCSDAQTTVRGSIDRKQVDNYNFLDGKCFNQYDDNNRYEAIFYDGLRSFKIFYDTSNVIQYQFIRLSDLSFLQTKYFASGKLEERIRLSVLDTTFSLDTIAMVSLEGNFIKDTIENDTSINLVPDGIYKIIDSAGFSMIKEFNMGKELPHESYWNVDLGYFMWAITKETKKDTLFYNRILDSDKKQVEKLLSEKKWMEVTYNFSCLRDNAVSNFYTGLDHGHVQLSFSQPDSGNHVSIQLGKIDYTIDLNVTWKLADGNHLIIDLQKGIRSEYLILFLDDQHLILKLLSSSSK